MKNNLFADLKMSLLNSTFVMICIIRKMLVLLKNQMNYLKDNIFKFFFKKKKLLFIFFFLNVFHNIQL